MFLKSDAKLYIIFELTIDLPEKNAICLVFLRH